MQTRIQITIIDEDRDKLFDKELELTTCIERMLSNHVSFPVDVQIHANEPEAEILSPS